MQLSNMQAEFIELIQNHHAQNELLIPVKNLIYYKQKIEDHFLAHFASVYPMVKYFTSDTIFITMVKKYIDYFPCRYSNINEYGEFFFEMMADNQVFHLPFLHELAQFEWLCHSMPTITDDGRLSVTSHGPSQTLNKTFILHPSCRLEQFHFPILNLRECYLKKEAPSFAIMQSQTQYVLITRPQSKLCIFKLKESEWIFFCGLQAQKTIQEAQKEAERYDTHFQLLDLDAMIEERIILDSSNKATVL